MDSERRRKLEADLRELLAEPFEGLEVRVEKNPRWNRMSVTFEWEGFAGLLPEERFQRLAAVVPEEFRTSRLAGFVWLELTPGESVDTFMKLPRSEDVEPREAQVYRSLARTGFFEDLAKALGRNPKKKCPGDFSLTTEILRGKKFTATKVQDARLVFIRHGAYCDCQALESVAPELAEKHGDA